MRLMARAAVLALLLAACGPEDSSRPAATHPAAVAQSTAPPAPPAAAPTPAPRATAEAAPVAAVHEYETRVYEVPAGSRPHDVAPAADGGVWYSGQGSGELGWLDVETGAVVRIPLGAGSRPHGVIVGPEGDAWVTDGGLNAIVRVDGQTHDVEVFALPADRPNANLNTAAFDGHGRLWFTGQGGVYGVFDPASNEMVVYDAPRGRGPYGIDSTPAGDVYYASLAGSHIARIDLETGAAEVIEPPTAGQGARRVWSDSTGAIWVSEWNAGQVARYDPASGEWAEWRLPGTSPRAYAVYVDERDVVWLSDFAANALVWFDARTEEFGEIVLPSPDGSVRQILGRPGEVWAPLSASDEIIVVRYR